MSYDPTTEDEFVPPEPSRPRSPRRWLIAGGALAVFVALGWRAWDERHVRGQPLPGDPVTSSPHEVEIRQLADHALSSRPRLDAVPVHPVVSVAANAQPDFRAFQIREDHRTYDLRAWKAIGPADGPQTSGVVMTRRVKLTKTAPADRIDFLTRTSGSDLVVRVEEPRPDAVRVFASQRKPVVVGQAMTEQRFSADVSHVPVGGPFEVVYQTTYWNSLQTPQEQWFGTIGYDGSTRLSILILFPDARPFQGGGLRNGPADGELLPYDGTQVVFKGAGGSWVYWEVPGPKVGHVYRVDWRW